MKPAILGSLSALVIFFIGCSMPVWTVLYRREDPDAVATCCGPQQGPLTETVLEVPRALSEAAQANAWKELFQIYNQDLVQIPTLPIFAAAVGGCVYGICSVRIRQFRRWLQAFSQ